MTIIRKITEPLSYNSDLVAELVNVFCSARKDRLQFLIDLHDREEDKRFLSQVVMPANDVRVAEIDGTIAAFIAFASGWINHLYVTKEFQRRGLGRQLLQIAKNQQKSRLQLWVFEINAPAIEFYSREAFKIVQRTDGLDNEAKMPDVLMSWDSNNMTSNR